MCANGRELEGLHSYWMNSSIGVIIIVIGIIAYFTFLITRRRGERGEKKNISSLVFWRPCLVFVGVNPGSTLACFLDLPLQKRARHSRASRAAGRPGRRGYACKCAYIIRVNWRSFAVKSFLRVPSWLFCPSSVDVYLLQGWRSFYIISGP